MAKAKVAGRSMTRAQVKAEAEKTERDLIIIEDRVYDATQWKERHPGGHLPIRVLRGRDATNPVLQTHPPDVLRKFLHLFEVARLEDADNGNEIDAAFLELSSEMERKGLFRTNYMFYVEKLSLFAVLLLLVVSGVIYSNSTWVHIACACGLGMFFQQIAFLGHDTGHNAITHHLESDSYFGLFVGNFLSGISIGWWKRSHNVHHIVTNCIEHDPDIQHLPVIAVAKEFLLERVFSTFYNRVLPNTGLAHIICRFQHFLYYPVMAIARYNLYAQSVLHTLGCYPYSRSEVLWNRKLQLLALLGFFSWLSLLVSFLPTFWSRVMFIFVSHGIAGILHVQITLSHFAMPAYKGVTYHCKSDGYVETQLKTSLNVTASPSMDWFHGGLHFQVEHHLWPRMPRHNLRKAQAYLLEFCKTHHLQYHTAPFFEANKIVFNRLRETSQHCKGISDILHDSFFAIG